MERKKAIILPTKSRSPGGAWRSRFSRQNDGFLAFHRTRAGARAASAGPPSAQVLADAHSAAAAGNRHLRPRQLPFLLWGAPGELRSANACIHVLRAVG